MRTSLIVAADEADTIGRAGTMPWHLPEDLRRFKRLTLGHALVVGRRTHQDIVAALGRPLPGRYSVVVTRTPGHPDGEQVAMRPGPAAALDHARAVEERDEVFVIGGAQVYAQLLGEVDRVYLTRVHRRVEDGDAAMPPGWLDGFAVVEESPAAGCSFLTLERR